MSEHTFNSEFCAACVGVCVQRRRAYPEIFDELSNEEEDALYSGEPTARVVTGFTSSEGATELEIYYFGGRTIVVPCGEAFNCGPLITDGKVPVQEILEDYRRELTLDLVGFEGA